jgi:glycosyltransferase involved in cell wall biosynthesis
MKSIAIIPAYNEGPALQEVVFKAKKHVNKIIVIDDGSSSPLKVKGCKLLRNKKNMKKGYSLMRGFRYAVDNGYDTAVTLDADGEHNPQQIPEFLEKIGEYDFVVGQRKEYRSLKRKSLNYFATFWFMLLIPGIRDMYCGFRAIKTDYLKKMDINASGFELEPEMLLEAVKQGMNIGFVDVQTKPLEKTHLKFEDYLKTNDLFDRWVLKNRDMIKCNIFKKYFLIISAHAGLRFSKALKKFKNKEKL